MSTLGTTCKNLFGVRCLEGKRVNVVGINLDIHLDPLWDAQTKYKDTMETNEDLIYPLMRTGPFPLIQDFKNYLLKLLSTDSVYPNVVEYKDESCAQPIIVGFISLTIDTEHLTCDIGPAWLDPRYRRQGIMDEAIYLILNYAFECAMYHRVQYTCNNANEASKKLALRNQFKLEGVLRNCSIVKGKVRDHTYLSIIDSEWKDVKNNIKC